MDRPTASVVDDHPLMRDGIARALDKGGFDVVASVGSLEEWAGCETPSDLLALDLYLGGRDAEIDAIRRLSPSEKILVISSSARPKDVLGAIEAGACGYITKQATDASLIEAARSIVAGGFSLSSALADVMHAELRRRGGSQQLRALSAREEEALRLIAEGFTHAQGAQRMGVSEGTFDTYVKRIREKVGRGNKADLVRFALDQGVIAAEGVDPPR